MLYEYAPSVRKMSVVSAFFLNDCFLKYIQKSVFLFFIRFVKFENWVDKLNNSNPVCGKVYCTGQCKMTMQLGYITFWKFTTFSIASIWKTMLAPAHELDQELFRHPNQSPIGIHKTNHIGQWEKPALAQDIVAHVMSPVSLIFIICEQTGGAMIRSKDCPSLLPSAGNKGSLPAGFDCSTSMSTFLTCSSFLITCRRLSCTEGRSLGQFFLNLRYLKFCLVD